MTKTNKLPPLSELGVLSEHSRNYPKRRAGTSMDHHVIDPPLGEIPVPVKSPAESNIFDEKVDPFYVGE